MTKGKDGGPGALGGIFVAAALGAALWWLAIRAFAG